MAAKSSTIRGLGLKGVAQIVAHQEPSEMQYLMLRGQLWWFSRRAPQPLSAGYPLNLDGVETRVHGNGYIRLSLKTSNRKEAVKLARKYAHLVDVAAEQRLNRKPLYAAIESAPSPYEIAQAADLMYATLLAADEDTAARAFAEAMQQETDDVRAPDRYVWRATDLPPETLEGEIQLLRSIGGLASFYLYQYCRKTVTEVTPELAPFASSFRRLVSALEARRQGIRVPTPENPTADSGIVFSQLYEKFREHRTNNKMWKHPDTSHSRDYFPIVRDFIGVVGDKPILTLTKADARKYSEHTLRRSEISQGTKSRNFDRIKAILRFGEAQFDIVSIVSPLEVIGGYKKVHQSYRRFTNAELKALFESDDYKNNAFKKPSQYWMPLLGLYTGARIAELATLELESIKYKDAIPCYYLSHPDGDNHGGKNEFAPRWVPVHPDLISAGFIGYVELLKAEGHNRLFPCLGKAARDGYAKRSTTDFIKYRRECGVGASSGERSEQTFHSFRATLISAMVQNRIDGDTRRALVGHASVEALGVTDPRDVHDRIYTQTDVHISLLSAAMAKVSFGLKISAYSDTEAMRRARGKRQKLET